MLATMVSRLGKFCPQQRIHRLKSMSKGTAKDKGLAWLVGGCPQRKIWEGQKHLPTTKAKGSLGSEVSAYNIGCTKREENQNQFAMKDRFSNSQRRMINHQQTMTRELSGLMIS